MRTGPPIDEEILAFLPAEAIDQPFMAGAEGIATLRRAMEEFFDEIDVVRQGTGAEIREEMVGEVPVIVIRPPGDRNRGAILSVHGGGLVAGGHQSALGSNARLALALDSVMVIPDYRLAPEHPYPAALDDVVTTWRWVAEGGLGFAVDGGRLVVMGGSSGGGIAAGLVLRCRRESLPIPKALVLLQPQLDDRNIQPSTFELENEAFWDRTSNATGWSAYLGGIAEVPSEAAPARELDLKGFPATFIEIAQVDLFRDEELDFATRLSQCGVPVELHMWAGAIHGFDGLITTRLAQRGIAARMDFLCGVLGTPPAEIGR